MLCDQFTKCGTSCLHSLLDMFSEVWQIFVCKTASFTYTRYLISDFDEIHAKGGPTRPTASALSAWEAHRKVMLKLLCADDGMVVIVSHTFYGLNWWVKTSARTSDHMCRKFCDGNTSQLVELNQRVDLSAPNSEHLTRCELQGSRTI